MKLAWVRALSLILAAFVLQWMAFAIGEDIGGVTVWVSLALFGFAVWTGAREFPRKYCVIAAIAGAVVGFAYVYVDWLVVRLIFLQVLQKPDEVVIWLGRFFSALLWPATLVAAILAGVSSYRGT